MKLQLVDMRKIKDSIVTGCCEKRKLKWLIFFMGLFCYNGNWMDVIVLG